eukprot:gb/GECH01012006.1/.p1 GENE.gb/GECH01012006.1/~~gb/GECH01012006.1/.p1  ORF type:complete len:230 (+),score=46.25 gb/GECH01012006.1/:1-690(+)
MVINNSLASQKYCTEVNLNVRSGNCLYSDYVTTLSPGEQVTRISEHNSYCGDTYSWMKIRLSDNSIGFAASRYLSQCSGGGGGSGGGNGGQGNSSPIDYSAHDLDILTKTLYGEARGESKLGQIGVAWVIINRAKDYRWPPTLAGVCQQPWQFSCWNPNDPNRERLENLDSSNSMYNQLYAVAQEVLNGEHSDPTNGANHYYATYIGAPAWAQGETPSATIGDHKFYNL